MQLLYKALHNSGKYFLFLLSSIIGTLLKKRCILVVGKFSSNRLSLFVCLFSTNLSNDNRQNLIANFKFLQLSELIIFTTFLFVCSGVCDTNISKKHGFRKRIAYNYKESAENSEHCQKSVFFEKKLFEKMVLLLNELPPCLSLTFESIFQQL